MTLNFWDALADTALRSAKDAETRADMQAVLDTKDTLFTGTYRQHKRVQATVRAALDTVLTSLGEYDPDDVSTEGIIAGLALLADRISAAEVRRPTVRRLL